MKRFLMMMALIGLVGNWNSTLTAQLVSPDSLYLNEDLPEINIVAVKPLIKAEADKQLGEFFVPVKLHREVVAQVRVRVEKQED